MFVIWRYLSLYVPPPTLLETLKVRLVAPVVLRLLVALKILTVSLQAFSGRVDPRTEALVLRQLSPTLSSFLGKFRES